MSKQCFKIEYQDLKENIKKNPHILKSQEGRESTGCIDQCHKHLYDLKEEKSIKELNSLKRMEICDNFFVDDYHTDYFKNLFIDLDENKFRNIVENIDTAKFSNYFENNL